MFQIQSKIIIILYRKNKFLQISKYIINNDKKLFLIMKIQKKKNT